MMQVRALLHGQDWFDLRDYRLNPPFGANIHWSHLIDLPLASLILILRPLIGGPYAELVAVAVAPMIPYLALLFGIALTARSVIDRRAFLLPAVPMFLAGMTNSMFMPERIDHHGWQIASGLGIVLALTGAPTRRNAAIAGLCAALWTHISLEGLPLAAAAGAWLGLCAIFGMRDDGDRLSAYLAAFTIAAAALLLGVKGPGAVIGLHCDSLSTVHIAGLGIVTLASLIAVRFSRPLRGVVLLLGGGAVAYGLRQQQAADRWASALTGGDPDRAPALMLRNGCAGCHTIPGVGAARGSVGPRLSGLADRAFIGGTLPNTPENLVRWIRDSRGINPRTAMPSTGITEPEARDIAAFLYASP